MQMMYKAYRGHGRSGSHGCTMRRSCSPRLGLSQQRGTATGCLGNKLINTLVARLPVESPMALRSSSCWCSACLRYLPASGVSQPSPVANLRQRPCAPPCIPMSGWVHAHCTDRSTVRILPPPTARRLISPPGCGNVGHNCNFNPSLAVQTCRPPLESGSHTIPRQQCDWRVICDS